MEKNRDILLTPAQLAERWSKPESTLAQWRWRGVGPAYLKIEGAVRYPLDAIEAYEANAITDPQTAA